MRRRLADPQALEIEIAALRGLDLTELRERWQKLYGRSAPPHLPGYLLFRVMAYKIQADALGDLERETVRFLDAVAVDWKKRKAAGVRLGKAPPPVPPVPARRSLKPGTILAREHNGELHRVVVMEDGFAWNGKTYGSLSEVARAITGTNWNGPRFFGLRDRSKATRTTAVDQAAGAP
jgi:Protein of unknown function (DUF2924)